MTKLLASVTTVEEARLAVTCGADIIDCKDPSRGALGALPIETVTAIRKAVPPRITLRATIGDLTAEPGPVAAATRAMAVKEPTSSKSAFSRDVKLSNISAMPFSSTLRTTLAYMPL